MPAALLLLVEVFPLKMMRMELVGFPNDAPVDRG